MKLLRHAVLPLLAVFLVLRLLIPSAAMLVVIAAGTLTALFEIASRSYLPSVISREELVELVEAVDAIVVIDEGGVVKAPMHGKLVALFVVDGEVVEGRVGGRLGRRAVPRAMVAKG